MDWIRENRPQLWNESVKTLFPKDYVRHSLSSSVTPCTDRIDAAGTLLFDPRKNQWIEEYITDLGKSLDFFPETKSPYDSAGEISEEGARLTGLKAGIPIVVGSTDTAAEMLGSGAVMDGDNMV